MDMIERLKIAGFTGNEAKVYLELLRRGPISANDLARKLSMDRTLAYQLLNNLINKGYAKYIVKERKKYFDASDPQYILTNLKEKEDAVSSMIPELRSLQKITPSMQQAEIYEGKRGLKIIFEEMMKHKDIVIFGATGQSYDILKFGLGHMVKEFELSRLKGRLILDESFKGHPMTKLKNMKVKFVKDVQAYSTTSVYGDTVAIHTLTDKPLIILMKNKDIAATYRNYFEYMWGNK